MEKFVPYKRWLHLHDDDIRQEFPDRPTEALAGEMQLNYYTVSRRATRMGVGKSETFMSSSMMKGSVHGHSIKKERREAIDRYMLDRLAASRTKYGPEVVAALREYYPDHTTAECAERFGISTGVVKHLAIRHGIRKSREHIHKVRSELKRKRRE